MILDRHCTEIANHIEMKDGTIVETLILEVEIVRQRLLLEETILGEGTTNTEHRSDT